MKLSNTYRRIAAAGLMLLYIFIATPVQFWHHHTTVSKERPGESKVTRLSHGAQSDACKICQHTYTAYVIDDTRYNTGAVDLPADNNSFFHTSFPSPFIDKASNKGPPPADPYSINSRV